MGGGKCKPEERMKKLKEAGAGCLKRFITFEPIKSGRWGKCPSQWSY